MTATTVATHPTVEVVTEERVVLPHVSWETYERLLADDEGRRVPRMTYDQGVLELVTPAMPHDEDADKITMFVSIVAAILQVPIRSVRSTTFRRADLERGFEADASFYIQSEPRIRGLREVDLSVDPPPDLVVEPELSRSAIDKLTLFASMGIPEVWRYDGRRISILILEEDHYRESATSLALPVLTREVITRFLAESRTKLSPDWFQTVSEWARAQHAATD